MKLLIALAAFAAAILSGCTSERAESQRPEEAGHIPADYVGPHFGFHQKHAGKGIQTEAGWDSLKGNPAYTKPAVTQKRHPDYKTFGWHMFSEGTSYQSYHYPLLWGISYFAYEVDPATGSYKDIHAWKTTPLVDSARAHGTEVFLTVANFGADNNREFLGRKAAWQTLADTVGALLKLRGAQGVNLDFEGLPAESRDDFSKFIAFFAPKLKAINPALKVSLCLYAVDRHKVFDIAALNAHIDFYTMMGYDYYGSFSNQAGPVAPLKGTPEWGEASLETSVEDYLDRGVEPQKLILGLPWYGAEWVVADTTLPSKSDKFLEHPKVGDIRSRYVETDKIREEFNAATATGFFDVKNADGTISQIWADDSLSLATKYDWILSKKLAGTGIWALSFDRGQDNLWQLLGIKFGQEGE